MGGDSTHQKGTYKLLPHHFWDFFHPPWNEQQDEIIENQWLEDEIFLNRTAYVHVTCSVSGSVYNLKNSIQNAIIYPPPDKLTKENLPPQIVWEFFAHKSVDSHTYPVIYHGFIPGGFLEPMMFATTVVAWSRSGHNFTLHRNLTWRLHKIWDMSHHGLWDS